MGIEGGRGFENPHPRSVEARIEGEMVPSFPEIDFDEADHIPLSDITWTTARLRFKRVGSYTKPARYGFAHNVDLYSAELDYSGKQSQDKTANLSLTTSEEKPVLFTGTKNGFYAHDPLMAGRDDPFYLIGLQPYELEERMSELSAIWHELGHVRIFHTNADTKLAKAATSLKKMELPRVANAISYGNHLADALPYDLRGTTTALDRHQLTQLQGRNYSVDKSVRLFHERNAWAGGMHLVRANDYPTGFQQSPSYFEYARLCLSSYAQHYGDRKFVNGWKQ